ncbi:MAG: sigma-54-dependent Fis family transcriptional regulator [Nitrospira sp.]|nr:sigma-54-dependent Fis family transcriptional regulator [Nitrospira sp.]
MKELIRILLISSHETVDSLFSHIQILEQLERGLPGERFVLDRTTCSSLESAPSPHLIFLHQTGLGVPLESLVTSVNRRWPDVPILGIFGEQPGYRGDHEAGIPPALRDFVLYPLRTQELALRVRRLLAHANQTNMRESQLTRQVRVDSLLGESAVFQAQVEKVPLFAGVDATVLVQGETGTGKEVFARAIHYSSPRKDRAFIPINCAALPDQLFENELFGHAKGAYTSAAQDQGGLVLEAEGGTLFLDEVDALNPSAQAKLLRFVQYREYRPLGCSRTRLANVRIIAASNHDLRQAVAERRFREDLFHRLNVLSLVVPPLRERSDDIPLLAHRFLQRFRRPDGQGARELSDQAIEKLLAYSWPGNVRELESTLQRAVVLCGSTVIEAQDIECAEDRPNSQPLTGSLRAVKTSATMDVERAYLVKTLVTFRGNVTHAAKAAGKERRSFQRLLRKYGIDRESFQQDASVRPGEYSGPYHPLDGHA